MSVLLIHLAQIYNCCLFIKLDRMHYSPLADYSVVLFLGYDHKKPDIISASSCITQFDFDTI